MRKLRTTGAMLLAGSLTLIATGAQAEGMGSPAELTENFPTPDQQLLLPENTAITRSEDGVHLHLDLMTPKAGSYTYPETIKQKQQRQPEVFTGWAFVFNYPELCETPYECGANDFNENVKAGVYNFAGTTNSLSQESGGEIVLNHGTDGYVRLAGDILAGQEQRPDLPPDGTTFPLENPMGAEIHAAIAPHGQFDAQTITDELYNPTGNPACGCWWVAVFDAPDAPADMASN
ncbi:MAG: hypothetical protein PVG27_06400 [Chloroflexota bacterium]|jgi:hypothetical protein